MSGIKRFEDLLAWQEARKLLGVVREITRGKGWGREFALADQMLRAARSVMSNIAEGFESSTPAGFNRYLGIARSSCAELRSHSYEAHDAGLMDNDCHTAFMARAKSVANLVSALKIAVENRIKPRSTSQGVAKPQ
jgi:four helix bundle protein